MREILFRGKRHDTGEWVYWTDLGRFTVTQSGRLITGKEGMTDWAYEMLTRPVTEGQYTGMKDVNGKRIFEGDVLRITDRFGRFVDWSVKFRKGAFSVKHPGCNYWCGVGEFDGYTMEVIGNIHDNPELLRNEAEK